MKRILLIVCVVLTVMNLCAQPARSRAGQQGRNKSNADAITTRAQISFPTAVPMNEDVVWRRDIYRELNLTDDANSGLYYPTEPVGSQMNLFTYIFKLMMSGPRHGGINAYEYRMDGNEVFNDSSRIKPLQFLDNYHIYYERTDRGIRLDNSDIPSAEVKGYYIKESAYYDQNTSTFHRKVIALCPIMYRNDEFGTGAVKYPLFWVKYDDLAPYLSKQMIMTSNLNNAATMSVEDYFTMNRYNGKIYKTNNMLGRTLSQYCSTDSALTAEQNKIERELKDFEKNIYGNPAAKDSLNSIADTKTTEKAVKKSRSSRRGSRSSTRATRRSSGSNSNNKSAARVTVRRQRH
ncbi:gliding motility protein GldN [Prevotella brunnea]|uniref:Gliding motility protein GldN n=1 Tax=Prevotella brunnea TaxID=2508867 RepID=A0A5C8GJC8_9BACT|nr:gliding motility protein GldN [Prevotella brunnea]MDR0186348.1 gliding motility protein GldN [Prevotella brunnea]TXJ62081.1 gliding motility protein GldN [Prevotella brunnea]